MRYTREHEHGNDEKGGDHVGIWHMAALAYDRCIWIRTDRGEGLRNLDPYFIRPFECPALHPAIYFYHIILYSFVFFVFLYFICILFYVRISSAQPFISISNSFVNEPKCLSLFGSIAERYLGPFPVLFPPPPLRTAHSSYRLSWLVIICNADERPCSPSVALTNYAQSCKEHPQQPRA